MNRRFLFILLALLVVALIPNTAQAGMPSVGLSELAAMRIDVISFFLVALLLSAAAVKWLWNFLARDFARLPRLSYAKACGVVVLWGLVFVIVLTMISGARELMTPGAWEKKGATYQLTGDDSKEVAAGNGTRDRGVDVLQMPDFDRVMQLKDLGKTLRGHAQNNDGDYPAATELPDDAWRLPGPTQRQYVYVPGQNANGAGRPLAYEPDIHGDDCLVLMTDGAIERMSVVKIQEVLRTEAPK